MALTQLENIFQTECFRDLANENFELFYHFIHFSTNMDQVMMLVFSLIFPVDLLGL